MRPLCVHEIYENISVGPVLDFNSFPWTLSPSNWNTIYCMHYLWNVLLASALKYSSASWRTCFSILLTFVRLLMFHFILLFHSWAELLLLSRVCKSRNAYIQGKRKFWREKMVLIRATAYVGWEILGTVVQNVYFSKFWLQLTWMGLSSYERLNMFL